MAIVEMVMPKMGESVMEGTVLSWLKKEGETIEQDESVLEVATDKVDTEVPATHGGVLKEILVKEGDVVPVGNPIAKIEIEGEEVEETNDFPEKEQEIAASQEEKKPITEVKSTVDNSKDFTLGKGSNNGFFSPLVNTIAKEEGISIEELNQIPGTGKDNRVTKKDILSYVANRSKGSFQNNAMGSATTQFPSVSISGGDEVIEMDRMRKMIAQRMVDSKRTSPHVTSFVEADLTKLVSWRNKIKNGFKSKQGQSFTFTPLFIHAIVKALQDFPMMNISVDGDRIIKKKNINVGMAVALPSGNLIVPVIHNADLLSLSGLAIKVNELASRARENKLKPDELSGGTYTISNVGTFGNVLGTPIIMQPQVGIMAFGAIKKKPAVIETSQGDMIGIRQFMFLSHSYDHRVVDGALGGMFVRRVADYLEDFDDAQTV